MTPRVRDVIKMYKDANLQGVDAYLNQPGMIVDPLSWEGKIKKLIDNKLYNSAKCEIELVGCKLLNI